MFNFIIFGFRFKRVGCLFFIWGVRCILFINVLDVVGKFVKEGSGESKEVILVGVYFFFRDFLVI